MMSGAYNNRYEFKQRGEQASEIICWDPHLERSVIISWLWTIEEETTVRACLERLLAVQSPNVLDVYDLVTWDKNLGVVHECCEGPPLTVVAPEESLKALYQVASAIAHLSAARLNVGTLRANHFRHTEAGVLKLAHLAREMLLEHAGAQLNGLPSVRNIASVFTHHSTGLPQRIVDELNASAQTPKSAAALAALAAAHLVKDMHRAVLTHQGRVVELNATRRSVSLAHPSGVAQLELAYNGLEFYVKAVAGEVLINNQRVLAGSLIPEACVIALGGASLPAYQRQFVTMDLSHPGVVL
jgi:hypothetical protein